MKDFPNEKISLQHKALDYKNDLYFPELYAQKLF